MIVHATPRMPHNLRKHASCGMVFCVVCLFCDAATTQCYFVGCNLVLTALRSMRITLYVSIACDVKALQNTFLRCTVCARLRGSS